jgi:hypothetical protein
MNRVRTAVVTAAFVTAAVAAPVAFAVQTDDFGLRATGHRSALLFTAGSRVANDTVEVYNRTATTLQIELGVVGATRKADGTFSFEGAGVGLARDVQLSSSSVSLAPHAQQLVNVTVNRPVHVGADEWAAVTAVERSRGGAGVTVRQRLAVFVGILAHPPGASSPSASKGHGTDVARWVAVGVAVALLAGAAALLAVRRRFSHASRGSNTQS